MKPQLKCHHKNHSTQIVHKPPSEYTWGDNYVILSTILIAAMLQVCLLRQCNVVNLAMFVNCRRDPYVNANTAPANGEI